MDSTVKTLIGLGGTALAAYAVYEFAKNQCASGGSLASTGFCSLFNSITGGGGLTLDPKYADPTVVAAAVAQMQAKGFTTAQIQAQLAGVIAAYNSCAAPGTWNTHAANCDMPQTVSPIPAPVFTSPAPVPTPVSVAPAPIPIQWPAGYAAAIQEMKMRAGNDTENFDQWAWFWGTGTAGPTMPALYGTMLTTGLMQSLINAGGGDRSKMISAEQFVAWLEQVFAAAGLSGLGILGGGGIPVPAWMIHGSGRYA